MSHAEVILLIWLKRHRHFKGENIGGKVSFHCSLLKDEKAYICKLGLCGQKELKTSYALS